MSTSDLTCMELSAWKVWVLIRGVVTIHFIVRRGTEAPVSFVRGPAALGA